MTTSKRNTQTKREQIMTTNKAYKMIKNTLAAYSFLSLEDVVKQANKTNPESFEAIAKAEIKILQEAMGL